MPSRRRVFKRLEQDFVRRVAERAMAVSEFDKSFLARLRSRRSNFGRG